MSQKQIRNGDAKCWASAECDDDGTGMGKRKERVDAML